MSSREQPTVLLVENDKGVHQQGEAILAAAAEVFESVELLTDFVDPSASIENLQAAVTRLSQLSGPTIAILDMNLLEHCDRGSLGRAAATLFECPDPSMDAKLDGLVLMKALVENAALSPLLIVTATTLGEPSFLRPGNLFTRAISGTRRTAADLRIVPNTSLLDEDENGGPAIGKPSLQTVYSWKTYLHSLRKVWDSWVLQDGFLRYWLAAWSKGTGAPGHLEHVKDWPVGEFSRDLMDEPLAAVDAFKCVFCGREEPSTQSENERVHLVPVAEKMPLGLALKLVNRIVSEVSSSCTLESGTSPEVHIHWPSSPGSVFLWRLQRYLGRLEDPRPPLTLGFDSTTQVVRLTIHLDNPWHFWAAVLTRADGSATRAFRDLLACRFPSASEEDWSRLRKLTEFSVGVSRIDAFASRMPNTVALGRGRAVDHPMCCVTVGNAGVTLSWPTMPNFSSVT